MKATAELSVEPGACPAVPALRWHSAAPVVLRRTGPRRLHLVQAAGGPLGGDDLGLAVRLAAGTSVRVCSAAATVVQPGAGGAPARWTVTAEVGPGATLCWWPEPTVLCDGAVLRSSLRVRLAPGASAVLRELVVLGRHGQCGGRAHCELDIELGAATLLRHTTLLDGADPVLAGPAGTGGVRAVGTLVVAGADGELPAPVPGAGERPGVRWACSPLDGPGQVLIALGAAGEVAALLDEYAPPDQPGP